MGPSPARVSRPRKSTLGPTLVVLAGGLSTRYGSAKPLAPVGPSNEALIDYSLFDAARSGYGGAILVVSRQIHTEMSEHVEELTGGFWPCRLVCQSADDFPAGVVASGIRTKPWGTGHAVWSTRHLVRGPFAVVNADDFYGLGAIQRVADHLGRGTPREYVAVTYRLADTLSTTTQLSRAILKVDPQDHVQEIREVLEIHHSPVGIVGKSPHGSQVSLSGDESASMGIWGFTPGLFPLLEEKFCAFLDRGDVDCHLEFYLSDALNALVASGDARIRAVKSGTLGFGVTSPPARLEVRDRIEKLVAEDCYPMDLRTAFQVLANTSRLSGTDL